MITVGDLHAKNTELRKNIILKFFDWIKTQIKPKEALMLLGDVFDVPLIDGDIIAFIMTILKDFDDVHIIRGNKNHDGNLLKPVSKLANVTIYEEVSEVVITDCTGTYKCLMLPNKKDMGEYQELTGEYNYVFGHFSNEDLFREKGVYLSEDLKGKVVLGHVHIQNELCLGVPYPTRYLEHTQKHHILSIDSESCELVSVPKIFTYHEVKFGDGVQCDYPYFQLFITGAPSITQARKKYAEYDIYKIDVVTDILAVEEGEIVEEEFSKKTPLSEHYKNYKAQNEIEKGVDTILSKHLEGDRV